MMKSDQVKYKIRKGHTQKEYFERFKKYYNAKKIRAYTEEEKHLMNPHHVYWEIVGPDKIKRYYELPNKFRRAKHLVPDHEKYHYPILVATAIALVGLIIPFTLYLVGRNTKRPVPPEPTPVGEEVMQRYYEIIDSGRDPYDEMSIADLANVGIYKLTKGYGDTREQPRLKNHYASISEGTTKSDIFLLGTVIVNIRNATIVEPLSDGGLKALDESIAHTDSFIAAATAIKARRDFSTEPPEKGSGFEVKTIRGKDITGPEKLVWYDNDPDHPVTYDDKKEYVSEAGKLTSNPFFYSITDETVKKETSSKSKDKDGNITLTMDLDPASSTINYVKRMKHVSDVDVECTDFGKVTLTYVLNKQCELQSSSVDENYTVHQFGLEVSTIGNLNTKYYHEGRSRNVPSIPGFTDLFDYSQYL